MRQTAVLSLVLSVVPAAQALAGCPGGRCAVRFVPPGLAVYAPPVPPPAFGFAPPAPTYRYAPPIAYGPAPLPFVAAPRPAFFAPVFVAPSCSGGRCAR